jgi:hypothetical protein
MMGKKINEVDQPLILSILAMVPVGPDKSRRF